MKRFFWLSFTLLAMEINCIIGSSIFHPVSVMKMAFLGLKQNNQEIQELKETPCSVSFNKMLQNSTQKELLQIWICSGKSFDDLGNYEQCEYEPTLKYALMTLRSETGTRIITQMGLCVPAECTAEDLQSLDKIIKKTYVASGWIENPTSPHYSFTSQEYRDLYQDLARPGFIITVLLILLLIGLSIFGSFVERTQIGDKKQNQNSMVEAIESEDFNQVSLEYKKEKWAIFIYSFSVTRNFKEIFFRPSKSIKDKKFQVFNGIRVFMMTWIILGHCYFVGSVFGITNYKLKQAILDKFLGQIIVSSDMAVSFFYFQSSFICMFSLIKRFQRDCQQNFDTNRETAIQLSDEQQQNIPKLNIKTLIKLIFARWLRLSFPTYLLVLFTAFLFKQLGTGPAFPYIQKHNMQDGLDNYWWTFLVFIQNLYPWTDSTGMYWYFFLANDLQFYIFVLIPSVYMYQKKNMRKVVMVYLVLLVLLTCFFRLSITIDQGYSSIIIIEHNVMFNDLLKRPWSNVGFYACGIITCIFYYEYSLAISNRSLRKRSSYIFMDYIGKTRSRSLKTQFTGGFLMFFVVFIRYSSFGMNEPSAENTDYGRWPIILNAFFNAFAHYLFIFSVILIILPIFIGKLSVIRDIFGADFFRPLSRISFSVYQISGLSLFLLFFSQDQHVYYDNQSMIFIFFALVLNIYLISFFVAIFFEYPFRTLSSLLLQPSIKIIRLKSDLAKELDIDGQYTETEESQMGQSQSRHSSGEQFKDRDNFSVNSDSNKDSLNSKLNQDELFQKAKLKLRVNDYKNKRLTKINEIDELSNYDYSPTPQHNSVIRKDD
ncbi:UNKNOWN [Stylonychia lemnae]|uniref:Acyltransferase 3 domain-containing protein n=1 Tax=Stylonychia lemnae TaxID=5949 RepID=A0A078B9S2_STYLE|nr:UNKNOWN [Stylonychia lemnae]|eukprot:CDW90007.1 UNKNOWN [Stylonychia lemnae]